MRINFSRYHRHSYDALDASIGRYDRAGSWTSHTFSSEGPLPHSSGVGRNQMDSAADALPHCADPQPRTLYAQHSRYVLCRGPSISKLGLSLALGAFLAGLIISETEFGQEALGSIIPFRDVFTSLFFISIGMLLDVRFLIIHPGQVILIVFAVMLLKTAVVCLVVLLLGLPIRTGLLSGLALLQVGEFSFVLFMRGSELGILKEQFYQLFLDVSIITMAMTPFAIALAPRLADLIGG